MKCTTWSSGDSSSARAVSQRFGPGRRSQRLAAQTKRDQQMSEQNIPKAHKFAGDVIQADVLLCGTCLKCVKCVNRSNPPSQGSAAHNASARTGGKRLTAIEKRAPGE